MVGKKKSRKYYKCQFRIEECTVLPLALSRGSLALPKASCSQLSHMSTYSLILTNFTFLKRKGEKMNLYIDAEIQKV